MAKSRLDLQAMLEGLLGSRNVYYQPPASVRMSYPAIVYELEDVRNTHANDGVYTQSLAYSLTVIDSNPDSAIRNAVSKLPKCKFSRSFTSDNLNHYVFTILY